MHCIFFSNAVTCLVLIVSLKTFWKAKDEDEKRNDGVSRSDLRFDELFHMPLNI